MKSAHKISFSLACGLILGVPVSAQQRGGQGFCAGLERGSSHLNQRSVATIHLTKNCVYRSMAGSASTCWTGAARTSRRRWFC